MAGDLPRTIENRIAGERVTFLATAEETGGAYVRTRNEVSAGAAGVVMHYHLAYTEAFELVEGTLNVCVGVEENHLVLSEGEPAFVPLNTAHRFWNSGAEPTALRSRSGRRAISRRRSGRRWARSRREGPTPRASRGTSSSSPSSTSSPRATW